MLKIISTREVSVPSVIGILKENLNVAGLFLQKIRFKLNISSLESIGQRNWHLTLSTYGTGRKSIATYNIHKIQYVFFFGNFQTGEIE